MLITKIYNLFLAAIDAYFGLSKPLAYPIKVHIELNDYCNLRCRMCGRQLDSIPKNTGEISFEIIKKLSPLFRRAIYVGLAGNGEPFLHTRIFDILKFIIDHKATPAVITNATLLDEKCAEKLTEIGPILLQPSIDSAVPSIYESIRVGASFEKVRENLINLKKIKDKKHSKFPVISIIACLMKETLPDVEKLVEFAYEIGAAEISFQNMLPYNPELVASLIKDVNEGIRAVERARQAAKKYGMAINYHPMGFGAERFKEDKKDKGLDGYFCENLWNLFHVELSGKVRYCCFWSGAKLGDLIIDDPVKIWRSKKFAMLRKSLKENKIPESCQNCHLLTPFNKKANINNILSIMKDVLKHHNNKRDIEISR